MDSDSDSGWKSLWENRGSDSDYEDIVGEVVSANPGSFLESLCRPRGFEHVDRTRLDLLAQRRAQAVAQVAALLPAPAPAAQQAQAHAAAPLPAPAPAAQQASPTQQQTASAPGGAAASSAAEVAQQPSMHCAEAPSDSEPEFRVVYGDDADTAATAPAVTPRGGSK